MAVFNPTSSLSKNPLFYSPSVTSKICAYQDKLGGTELTNLRSWAVSKRNPGIRIQASREHLPALIEQHRGDKSVAIPITEHGSEELFDDLKQRFLSFKKHKYMENLEHFENLAKSQSPKFMVIACADSRVCPSNILGFQPGEAFVVRNVANMVPPYKGGPSETNAALEFAVNSLKVENILVIGHSKCGGIRALMSMHDDVETSSLIGSWVSVGMDARKKTKASACNLSFDQQCRHCEKESVNCSLMNLMTYPWIEEKVRNGELSIHGGYYDFVDCTFEKWALDYKERDLSDESGTFGVKDRSFWC